MATADYYAWVRDGRPVTPSVYIREYVAALKVAYPRAAGLFSWFADEAHYTAEPPQDHTPYSHTAWPVSPNPYPRIHATDVMHRPDLDVDCFKIFDYWLAEAKAGRTPWVKYIIWRGQRYDVRNRWVPVASSGHFDHIHKSGRTDWTSRSIGSWDPIPPEDREDMTPQEKKDFHYLIHRVKGIEDMDDPIVIPPATFPAPVGADPGRSEENKLAQAILASGGGGTVPVAHVHPFTGTIGPDTPTP